MTAPSGLSAVLNNVASVSEAGLFIGSSGVWHTSNQRVSVLTLLTDGSFFTEPQPPPVQVIGIAEPLAGQVLTTEQATVGVPYIIGKIYVETTDPKGNRFILSYMSEGEVYQVPITLTGAGTKLLDFEGLFGLKIIAPQSPVTLRVENAGSAGSVYFAHVQLKRVVPNHGACLDVHVRTAKGC